jgi:hypothetical protein
MKLHVPDPATFGLLGGALLVFGIFRRRFSLKVSNLGNAGDGGSGQ